MKNVIALFLFCLIFKFPNAQTSASFDGNKDASIAFLQKAVPPSPTAASLGSYGNQQIGMFTGTASANIPIYEIKTNGYTLPISLSYSSNGLRVTEAASSVGLGWTLLGGGVVTRVVKGLPDANNNHFSIAEWPWPFSYSVLDVSDDAWDYLHFHMASNTIDGEPDLYMVKAGKLNVKFYYDLHNRIQTTPYNNNVKIKFDPPLNQYVITDEDGSQYFFGGAESNEQTYTANPPYGVYTTSWFLTKIITPVGANILFHNTLGPSEIRLDQYSETEEQIVAAQTGDCASVSKGGRVVSWSEQTFLPVFLNSIETDQEIVYFTRDAIARADLPGDYPMTGIKVYSKSSAKYEYNYSFATSYFPQTLSNCGGDSYHLHSHTAICKRLRLDQFIDKGSEGNTIGYKVYQFQYSVKPVPPRCSLSQDYWGYYNGAVNPSLLPQVTDPVFSNSSFNAVSRDANPLYGDAGTLQKIIYPTGGETDFTYEPNEIKSLSSSQPFQTVTAGISGISPALQSSVTFTIANYQMLSISFNLEDLNLADQGLQRKVEIVDQSNVVHYFAFNSNSNNIVVFGDYGFSGFPPGTYTLRVSRNYSYGSYPSIPPVIITASVTYMATVAVTTVTKNLGGVRVKKVVDKTDPLGADFNIKEYTYENPVLVAAIQSSDCIGQYNKWYVNQNGSDFSCGFRSRNTTSVQPMGTFQGSHIAYGKVTCSFGISGSNGKSEYYYSTDPDQGGFSLNPIYRPITSYDHRRGNLLQQIDYDVSGNILQITTNTYEYILKYAGVLVKPYYTKDAPLHTVNSPSLIPYKLVAFADYAIPSEWVRLNSTSQTVYQGSSYITTTKDFIYGNSNHSYVTKTVTINSKGETLESFSKYPLDFKPVSPSSNEEIERKFDADYTSLFNTFFSCVTAANNPAAINACYASYQTAYSSLLSNRSTAFNNYQTSFVTLANGTADPVLKAKYQLISKNKLNEVIENTFIKNTSQELAKIITDYKDFSGNILMEKVNKSFSGNPLELDVKADSYDAYGNILQATPRDGVISSFIWDYHSMYPIAKVTNASLSNIAYTSFEAESKGNWTFSGTPKNDFSCPTGKKYYTLGTSIVKTGLSTSTTYIVSFWRRTTSAVVSVSGSSAVRTGRVANGWTYYEHTVINPAVGTITISGSNADIDELRLYPKKALMSTFTYEPLIGKVSECDANNRIVFYEYDEQHRLILIRDQDKNIIKKISYNYNGQIENTSIYYNIAKSGMFRKTNCTSCQVGTSATYTVPANVYSSTISQGDADQKAQVDINANGQIYTNSIASCVAATAVPVTAFNMINISFSVQFHNTCTGSNYNFTIANNASSVSLSGIPEGLYNVTFTPNSGGEVQYTYTANGIWNYSNSTPLLGVPIGPGSNNVRITL